MTTSPQTPSHSYSLHSALFAIMTFAAVTPMDDVLESVKNAWKSSRLHYREMDPQDEALRKWMHTNIVNMPSIAAFSDTSLLKPHSVKWTESLIERLAKSPFPVIIVLPDGDKEVTIGAIGLMASGADTEHHRVASMGIFIATEFQNNGYGTEASQWIVDYGFRFMNLHSINLSVYSFNERAMAVYRKIGFRVEGKLRERLFLDRKWHDIIQMGILEHEWDEMRKQV